MYDRLNRLRERWKDLTVRGKLTSSGAKLVNAAVKHTIEAHEASLNTFLLPLKLKLLNKQIDDYRRIKYRSPAYPSRCPSPPKKCKRKGLVGKLDCVKKKMGN